MEESSRSTSRSAVSRRFVAMTQTALADLLAKDLSELDLVALMIDGMYFAEHLCVVALGIDIDEAIPYGCTLQDKRSFVRPGRRVALTLARMVTGARTAPRPEIAWCSHARGGQRAGVRMSETAPFADAVVLAAGTSTRMGGSDKLLMSVGASR